MILSWRRLGFALRAAVFAAAVLLIAFIVHWQRPQDESPYLENSLFVFVFVNFVVGVLCVLAFLIGRNIVKLIFDRRKSLLGSRLRTRLVVAFVGLTLIPTIILFILASDLLTKSLEGWFSSQVESSVSGAVEVARQHYNFLKDYVLSGTEKLGPSIEEKAGFQGSIAELEDFLEQSRKSLGLFSLQIVDRNGKVLSEVHNAAATIENFSAPQPERTAIQKAGEGHGQALAEDKGASKFIRAYVPLQFRGTAAILISTYRVNPDLSHAISNVNDSYKEYEQLSLFRHPLKSGPILTLSLITGLLLFSAIWIGFYMAREISVPIQRLAEGTEAVARGNYNFQIKVAGDDEIGFLVKSFNRMTSDLRTSRDTAEGRRVFIETILSNLAVGVIGLDTRRKVTSVNMAASRLYQVEDIHAVIGKNIEEVLQGDNFEQIRSLLEAVEEEGGAAPGALEKPLRVASTGREVQIVCSAGKIIDSNGGWIGTVLLFDDVTELSKAQHMAAWREVAQRIAHEIKNPLTPIQLSAQRLQKLVSQGGAPGASILEATQTIVENVDSIKRLANEFTNFARMPTVEFKSANLNSLISDVISPFAENKPEIVFQLIADNKMPDIMMDPEQVRRIVINLIDNAITALESGDSPTKASGGGKIVIKTSYDRKRKVASFEVSDNGPGIRTTEKTRIFEPYYTTKKGGTGLGLAIVTSIVSDHQGDIRVYDNTPRGATFIVDLPLSPKGYTQRRFAAGG